jgi:hypothetical protein
MVFEPESGLHENLERQLLEISAWALEFKHLQRLHRELDSYLDFYVNHGSASADQQSQFARITELVARVTQQSRSSGPEPMPATATDQQSHIQMLDMMVSMAPSGIGVEEIRLRAFTNYEPAATFHRLLSGFQEQSVAPVIIVERDGVPVWVGRADKTLEALDAWDLYSSYLANAVTGTRDLSPISFGNAWRELEKSVKTRLVDFQQDLKLDDDFSDSGSAVVNLAAKESLEQLRPAQREDLVIFRDTDSRPLWVCGRELIAMQVRADSKWTHWIEEQPSASFMNRVTEHRDSLAKIVSVVLNSELENDKYLSRLTDNQLLPYSTVIANEIIQTDFPELILSNRLSQSTNQMTLSS